LSSEAAIARIAPTVLEHFGHRGLVNFHMLHTEPPALAISVELLGEARNAEDLNLLRCLAEAAGLRVERSCVYEEILWVEVSLEAFQPALRGLVLPFRKPAARRLPAIR
jgi:hypothetical protein